MLSTSFKVYNSELLHYYFSKSARVIFEFHNFVTLANVRKKYPIKKNVSGFIEIYLHFLHNIE